MVVYEIRQVSCKIVDQKIHFYLELSRDLSQQLIDSHTNLQGQNKLISVTYGAVTAFKAMFNRHWRRSQTFNVSHFSAYDLLYKNDH
jgi:hypothetical protein